MEKKEEELSRKIDIYIQRKSELDNLNDDHKKRVKTLELEVKALASDLTDFAMRHDVDVLESSEGTLEFRGRTERVIDPKKLLKFLTKAGKAKDFYKYIKPQVTVAVKYLGEDVLIKERVLTISVNRWASIKIRR